jgi:hypothetical protein
MALIRGAEVATLCGAHDRAEEFLGEVLVLLRNTAGSARVADAVEMAALALGARERHQPATRLLGACDALRALSGEVADTRTTHPQRLRYQAGAEWALGSARFDDEFRRGATLSRDEMVREALTELRPTP